MPKHEAMKMLRNKIYIHKIGGKTIILPIKQIAYLPHFNNINIPTKLVGNPHQLLKTILQNVNIDIEEFSKLSNINLYLLNSFIKRNQKISLQMSKLLEKATRIPRSIWLNNKQLVTK